MGAYRPRLTLSGELISLLGKVENALGSGGTALPPLGFQEVGRGLRHQGVFKVYALFDRWQPLSERDFLQAHAVMMLDGGGAGHYRGEEVVVRNGGRESMLVVPAFRVPWLMRQVFEWLRSTSLHPLLAALLFHYEVAMIHPFSDGNGRMCRFWVALLGDRWMPHPLWRELEWRLKLDKPRYYSILEGCALSGESTPFLVYVLTCLLAACEAGRSSGRSVCGLSD